jgi:hypothetical protein
MGLDHEAARLLVGLTLVLSGAATLLPAHAPSARVQRTLADFPASFTKDVLIVVGEDACPVTLASASAIAARLQELTGNRPTMKRDVEVSSEDRRAFNLILIGAPDSNRLLREAHEVIAADRVTPEYPGTHRGILQIFSSPWSEDRTLLLLAGSDARGVKAAARALTAPRELDGDKATVEWTEGDEPPPPYRSKLGATLSLLLTLRESRQVPRAMKSLMGRETVSVSIRFSHELSLSDLRSLEELGLQFATLPNGEVAHSGAIYGADVPWDRVDELAELDSVLRLESVWKPAIEQPAPPPSAKKKEEDDDRR